MILQAAGGERGEFQGVICCIGARKRTVNLVYKLAQSLSGSWTQLRLSSTQFNFEWTCFKLELISHFFHICHALINDFMLQLFQFPFLSFLLPPLNLLTSFHQLGLTSLVKFLLLSRVLCLFFFHNFCALLIGMGCLSDINSQQILRFSSSEIMCINFLEKQQK